MFRIKAIKSFNLFKVSKTFNKFRRIVCEDTGEICSTYSQYLRSKHWKLFKKRFKESSYYRGRCYVCSSDRKIHFHHLTYDRIGREYLKDIVELCKKCHRNVHRSLSKGVTWESIVAQLK